MFPRPIEQTPRAWQISYQSLLPLALLMWLAPLIAVAIFSVKPDVDFTQGNYWGSPVRSKARTTTDRSSSIRTCRAISEFRC